MTLAVEGRESAADAVVLANPSAVEQVSVEPGGQRLQVRRRLRPTSGSTWNCGFDSNEAALVVRDHGPGVSPSARRRMFRSFSKSARDAAETAPGIGLGLTLSRRLARDMGGDLRLDPTVAAGACFVLGLKKA